MISLRKKASVLLAIITLLSLAGTILAFQNYWALALAITYIVLIITVFTVFHCTQFVIHHVLTALGKSRSDVKGHSEQLQQQIDILQKKLASSTKDLRTAQLDLKTNIDQSVAQLEQHVTSLINAEDAGTRQLGLQIEEALRSSRLTAHAAANNVITTLHEAEVRIEEFLTDNES